jgi:hypothetical protein
MVGTHLSPDRWVQVYANLQQRFNRETMEFGND